MDCDRIFRLYQFYNKSFITKENIFVREYDTYLVYETLKSILDELECNNIEPDTLPYSYISYINDQSLKEIRKRVLKYYIKDIVASVYKYVIYQKFSKGDLNNYIVNISYRNSSDRHPIYEHNNNYLPYNGALIGINYGNLIEIAYNAQYFLIPKLHNNYRDPIYDSIEVEYIEFKNVTTNKSILLKNLTGLFDITGNEQEESSIESKGLTNFCTEDSYFNPSSCLHILGMYNRGEILV